MSDAALLDDPLIDDREVAKLLSISPQTLAVWRTNKRYPLPYVKLGRAVRYRTSAVRAFIESRTVRA